MTTKSDPEDLKTDDTVYHHSGAEKLPKHSQHDEEVVPESEVNRYWRDNKLVLFVLMGVWVFVTFGCGIILGDWLDQYSLFGFPLGFWFTQQGAMLIYVLLIFIYHFWMKRIEAKHGVDDKPDVPAGGQ